jgi:hypothetical protein
VGSGGQRLRSPTAHKDDTMHKAQWMLCTALLCSLSACAKTKGKPHAAVEPAGHEPARREPVPLDKVVWSPFGAYAPLPAWSGWCGDTEDASCAAQLAHAVEQPSSASRLTARRHGFHLWAAISSPLPAEGKRNDAHAQRTDLYGTTGCWSSFDDGKPACSGNYPRWLSWPNTGKPFVPNARSPAPETATSGSSTPATAASAPVQSAGTLRARRRKHIDTPGAAPRAGFPNPQQLLTVDTVPPDNVPTYQLPPQVLERQCGIPLKDATEWLAAGKTEDIILACTKAGKPDVYCASGPGICDGTVFVNQGDVMIATESLSVEGYADIQRHRLYSTEALEQRYQKAEGSIAGDIGKRFVSTKHMYWPVKACRPGAALGTPGCRVRYGALPPWQPARFRRTDYATSAEYLGYERWGQVVAIDTCSGGSESQPCPKGGPAKLALAHVQNADAITTAKPEVYPAASFHHVQISQEALETRFTAADRALLDQAMIWAYGDEAAGFEPGDFLVTVAMHVNTKEIPSWTLQSVWWSPMKDRIAECPLNDYNHCFGQSAAYAATQPDGKTPNAYSGLTAQEIEALDAQAGRSWREHYVLIDSYGIGYQLDGVPVTLANYFKKKPPAWYEPGPPPKAPALLPIAANVYIEPVIHPLGTDCQNCHRRSGFPESACSAAQYPNGCGQTNYQTAQCAALLGDYGPSGKSPCMTTPWAWHDASGDHCETTGGTLCNGTQAFPVLDVDQIWIIADGHVQRHPHFDAL